MRPFFTAAPWEGGSITYACTLLRAPDKVWESGTWAGLTDWKREMPAYYDTASRMLGVTENRFVGPADRLLKKTAEATGTAGTFYRTSVGIFLPPVGEPGNRTVPDPYFGGCGPERTSCGGCGGCMMGCRTGAKNTLDKNYLYLAEKRGVEVFAETKVVDVKPLDGASDGSAGYEVRTEKSTALLRRQPRKFTCQSVVFAASSLGTMELLFQLRDKGSLPAISRRLGKRVRTNSESLIGARIPGCTDDLFAGHGDRLGCVHRRPYAHRGGALSERLGRDGLSDDDIDRWAARSGRMWIWLRSALAMLVRHPIKTYRMYKPWGWAKEAVILLCMQTLDGHIEMHWNRPWFWPFRKRMRSVGQKVPTYIPQANEFAKKFAEAGGGVPMSTLPEIFFNVPGTAHCIGGCVIGNSPEHGVVDERHRVFGYQNLYICDGSVVAANLGVNPSLTITALAERAMSFIAPAKQVAPDDEAEPSASTCVA